MKSENNPALKNKPKTKVSLFDPVPRYNRKIANGEKPALKRHFLR